MATKKKKALSIEEEYEKYNDLPNTKKELVKYLEKSMSKSTYKKAKDLADKYNNIKRKRNTLAFTIDMIPKGCARPRLNLRLKSIYVPDAAKRWKYFENLVKEGKIDIKQLITTSCKMTLKFYRPMPSNIHKDEMLCAELGIVDNVSKPDWDNLGKTTDMFNENLWKDDSLVNESHIYKYFSIKPRIEVKIEYLDEFYDPYNIRTRG